MTTWVEQTTTREIPEDEIPPHIRWKIGKTSKKNKEIGLVKFKVGLVKFIEKYYYQQKNSNKWTEQTTSRTIPEDEVPPHVRKRELEELVGVLTERTKKLEELLSEIEKIEKP